MYRYLALGDSYTVGEAVDPQFSFPCQLSALLDSGRAVDLTIIAKTGWTTDELMQAIEERKPEGVFNLVTLLIGVNNQYRGYDIEVYRREFSMLLNHAINFAGGNARNVIIVSIPDWGVTPFGKGDKRGTLLISKEIDRYNGINREISDKMGVVYADITADSRNADEDPSLTASDGLHPSGAMYAMWVERIRLLLSNTSS